MVHVLDEISHVHCFWNFARLFFEQFHLFLQQKNQFSTFWELLSKNTIRDAIHKNLPKLAIFEKSSFFSKKSNFWTFWETLGKKIWDAFWKFCWKFAFWKTPKILPKKAKFLTFWDFLSKNTIWDGLYNKHAKLIGFRKNSVFIFWTTLPVFPKKIQSLNFLRNFRQKNNLRRNL